jgi:hypothetical protein
MNGAYDFESRMGDINRQFGQQRTGLERAQFMGQQRFPRKREQLNLQFGREFPRYTGQWAGRLGSGVQSGVFRRGLGQQVGDFNRLLQDLDVESAMFQSQGEMDLAALEAQRQREINALLSQYGRSRVDYNPFAGL